MIWFLLFALIKIMYYNASQPQYLVFNFLIGHSFFSPRLASARKKSIKRIDGDSPEVLFMDVFGCTIKRLKLTKSVTSAKPGKHLNNALEYTILEGQIFTNWLVLRTICERELESSASGGAAE